MRFASHRSSLVVLGIVAACSSDPASGVLPPAQVSAGSALDGGAAAAPVAASEYCESVVTPFCAFYMRCGRIVASSEEQCRKVFLETCNARYEPRDVDLERAGLVSLSSTGIDACAAHLAAVACEEQANDLGGACGSMWVGHSPAGSPCGIDVESFVCAPGTACILSLDFCGKCEATVAVGEPCETGLRCAPTASCVSGSCVARSLPGKACDAQQPCTTGARCVAGTCVAPATVGEGATCDPDHRCAYRSTCDSGNCVRTSLLGEACTSDRGCASGRCQTSKCVALADDGDTCTSSSQCSSGACTKGKCTALPSVCFTR